MAQNTNTGLTSVTGNVTSTPVAYTTVNVQNTSSTNYGPPAGKKWTIVACGALYNTASSRVAIIDAAISNSYVVFCASVSGDDPAAWSGTYVLTNTSTDRLFIRRSGFFTYYEEDE